MNSIKKGQEQLGRQDLTLPLDLAYVEGDILIEFFFEFAINLLQIQFLVNLLDLGYLVAVTTPVAFLDKKGKKLITHNTIVTYIHVPEECLSAPC